MTAKISPEILLSSSSSVDSFLGAIITIGQGINLQPFASSLPNSSFLLRDGRQTTRFIGAPSITHHSGPRFISHLAWVDLFFLVFHVHFISSPPGCMSCTYHPLHQRPAGLGNGETLYFL